MFENFLPLGQLYRLAIVGIFFFFFFFFFFFYNFALGWPETCKFGLIKELW